MNFKKICVMGLGYIGLPTASILATKGYDVLGVDVSQKIVDTINSGKIHIVEPDLDILVKSGVQSGHLKASLEPQNADVFFICVPTPFKENHQPDVSFVKQATKTIAPFVKEGNLVILESTSPVGTTENIVAKILKENGVDIDRIYIAHAPERVLPGHILKETIENDRIIGGINKKSSEVCEKFYKTFVKGDIFLTNARTAELAKLVENSHRDVNIAFANELAKISEELNINVWKLIELANKHPRVNILTPGPGVGGHCLAVDPWFIVSSTPNTAKLIKLARQINESRPQDVIEKVIEKANKFKKAVVGCLGISYKPDIDDIRESPALEIVRILRKNKELEVLVHDPYMEHQNLEFNNTELKELLEKSDILVLLVNHKEYYSIEKNVLNEKIIIDTRGVFNDN